MPIPPWLLLGDQLPYAINQKTLQQPAGHRGVPRPQTEQDFRVPSVSPAAAQAAMGAGGDTMSYAAGGPPPSVVDQLAAAMAPQNPANAVDRYKAAQVALNGTDPDKKTERSSSSTDKDTRKLESAQAVTTKEMEPITQTMNRRNLVLGEVPAGIYPEFPHGISDVALPGIKAERKRMNDLGGVVEALAGEAVKKNGQFDFSPLLALMKGEYGKDLTYGYTSPQKEALDLGKLGADLTGTLTAGTGKLTSDELKYMESLLTDKTTVTAGNSKTLGHEDTVGEKDSTLGILKLLMGLGGKGGISPDTPQRPPSQVVQDRNKRLDDEHHEDKLDKKITDFTNHRDKFYPSLVTSLGELDSLIAKNEGKVPGYVNIGGGRYELPFDFMKSEEGKTVSRNMSTILSAVTNRYSGAASSEQEARRIAAGLGQKFAQGETQFKEALRDLSKAIKQSEADREKALGDEGYGELRKRGITTSDSINYTFGLGDTPAPAATEPAGAATPTPEEAAAELARRKAAKGK